MRSPEASLGSAKTDLQFIPPEHTPFIALDKPHSDLTGDSDFDNLLVTAVDRALVDTMGESVSRAVKACLEISTITRDPSGFTAQLQKFSGGTNLIEIKIMRNLASLIDSRNSGIVVPEGRALGQFIESCRGQFNLR